MLSPASGKFKPPLTTPSISRRQNKLCSQRTDDAGHRQRAASPHQLRQICWPASAFASKAHQSSAPGPGPNEREVDPRSGTSNTALQSGLRLAFSRLRHATMASTFGICAPHKRKRRWVCTPRAAPRCQGPARRSNTIQARGRAPITWKALAQSLSSLASLVGRSRCFQAARSRTAAQ